MKTRKPQLLSSLRIGYKSEGTRKLVHNRFQLLLQILTAGPLDSVVTIQIEMH